MSLMGRALRGIAGPGRGPMVKRIPFLFKKGWQLFRREGIRGVWQKCQFHGKLAQGGSPNERYERWLEQNSQMNGTVWKSNELLLPCLIHP